MPQLVVDISNIVSFDATVGTTNMGYNTYEISLTSVTLLTTQDTAADGITFQVSITHPSIKGYEPLNSEIPIASTGGIQSLPGSLIGKFTPSSGGAILDIELTLQSKTGQDGVWQDVASNPTTPPYTFSLNGTGRSLIVNGDTMVSGPVPRLSFSENYTNNFPSIMNPITIGNTTFNTTDINVGTFTDADFRLDVGPTSMKHSLTFTDVEPVELLDLDLHKTPDGSGPVVANIDLIRGISAVLYAKLPWAAGVSVTFESFRAKNGGTVLVSGLDVFTYNDVTFKVGAYQGDPTNVYLNVQSDTAQQVTIESIMLRPS